MPTWHLDPAGLQPSDFHEAAAYARRGDLTRTVELVDDRMLYLALVGSDEDLTAGFR